MISLGERPSPGCRGRIAPLTADAAGARATIASLGDPMVQTMERSLTDGVGVPAELLDEPEPVDIRCRCVMQRVQLIQATPELTMTASRTHRHRGQLIRPAPAQRTGAMPLRTRA
jgi:hypothetical protein